VIGVRLGPVLRSAAIAVLLALAVTVAACDEERPAQQGAAPGSSLVVPSVTASDDDAVDPAPSPSASPSPSKRPTPSKSASASASASTVPPVDSSAWAGRLPKFGPPPAPHRINFPEGAGAPYYARIPTDQPVAFLTIDDGWVKRPEALQLLKDSGVKVTLFLTINAIKDNPGYFKRLRDAGADIQAHTLTHPNLKGKSYDFQKREICGSADQLSTLYGKRPTLFRPPFGDKDATTLQVAHDCNLQAGFFWKETIDKGIVRYQEGHEVKQGDIILMHFRDRFVDDFIAALQAISAAGLTPALLVDYMPAA
jgi:peptidoglycan/xylan/chitin deacetylase (PgdA/CDA1 family)